MLIMLMHYSSFISSHDHNLPNTNIMRISLVSTGHQLLVFPVISTLISFSLAYCSLHLLFHLFTTCEVAWCIISVNSVYLFVFQTITQKP